MDLPVDAQQMGLPARIVHLRGTMCRQYLLPLALALATMAVAQTRTLPYDLANPTVVHELPGMLLEVSALTDVDAHTVACLQDEQGKVFRVDLRDGAVSTLATFSGPGDFEGLTRVGEDYLALRSDGLVFRLRPEKGLFAVHDTFRLAVLHNNLEGLGYDEQAGRVLVSPKDIAKGGPDMRDRRVLYAFDPLSATHPVEEVLQLSLQDLMTQAKALGISIPMKPTDNGREVPALKLRYSSVAVHPRSGHYYLLSAVDRSLLVLDRAGTLMHLAWLDERLLPKPEGITFLANGDLVLSSEGKGRTPVVVRYAMKPE